MKKHAKAAVAYAEAAGYTFERRNTKGAVIYRAPSGHEVSILPSCDEHGLRRVRHDVDRARGIGPDLTQKRHPEAIKARQERERLLLADERRRHRERIEQLTRAKSALLLDGHGSHLTFDEVGRIERLIEAENRHHNETVRQMVASAAVAS